MISAFLLLLEFTICACRYTLRLDTVGTTRDAQAGLCWQPLGLGQTFWDYGFR